MPSWRIRKRRLRRNIALSGALLGGLTTWYLCTHSPWAPRRSSESSSLLLAGTHMEPTEAGVEKMISPGGSRDTSAAPAEANQGLAPRSNPAVAFTSDKPQKEESQANRSVSLPGSTATQPAA